MNGYGNSGALLLVRSSIRVPPFPALREPLQIPLKRVSASDSFFQTAHEGFSLMGASTDTQAHRQMILEDCTSTCTKAHRLCSVQLSEPTGCEGLCHSDNLCSLCTKDLTPRNSVKVLHFTTTECIGGTLSVTMECNRDEALRSRFLAEQKFLQHDLVGAKKFALKAQCLFPDLEGLPQLIAVLDVHIVAQQKLHGMDLNWYGILQTDASADEATIRKQYRKLALILHPDKNKAMGAEAAFKLISEAWRVLSDKEKKAAHDAKRSCNAFDSTTIKPAKGFCNFTHFSACYHPRPADNVKKSFWTGCPSCKMQFEYLRVHENKSISCPTCGKVFRAFEIQDTSSKAKVPPAESSFQAARSSFPEKESHKDWESSAQAGTSFSFHWGTYKFNAAKHTASANATAQIVQQTYESVRRERIKAQREAREKAAMERMKVEIEARRREHRERKQRRKEQQEQSAKGLPHPSDDVAMSGSRCSRPLEPGRADTVSSTPSEGMEKEAAGLSSLKAGNDQKESGSRIGGKVARMDQMQESFRCRVQNSFDSTNSYDSSDAFSFSKRLKVDV